MSSNCNHGRPAIDPEIERKIYSEIDTLVRTMEHWTADASSLTATAQDFFAKAYVLLSSNSTQVQEPSRFSPARRCDMLLKLLIATGIDATIELESSGGKGRPCHRVAVLAILIAEFETFVRTRREFHADRTRRYGDFAQICEYFAIRSTCGCQSTLWKWSLNSSASGNPTAPHNNNNNNAATEPNNAANSMETQTARRNNNSISG